MSASDDRQFIDDLVRDNLRNVADRQEPARRGPHPKAHGCVTATFRVLPDLPEDLRKGLFARPGEYAALIRFSNGLHDDD
ncbi:MAG: hypothetical protein ACXWUR_05320, partial [Allosphingosinicella sp.]